jgi:hypothetical protein
MGTKGLMPLKTPIRTPLIGGLIFGALSFLITVADITIKIASDIILGPWEIINTLSAALFGPIGLLITELGLDISAYFYLIKGVYPAPQDLYFMMGDFVAHTLALLLVAVGYRLIYQRMKMPGLLAGWILIMTVYYIVEIFLAVTLFRFAVPGLDTSYAFAFSTVRVEFPLVLAITSLILLALPKRYRRPQWYRSVPEPGQNGELSEQ